MIDWSRADQLREEVGEEAFLEVAEIFIEEVDEVIQRLKTNVVAADFQADMHFLKGSALNLGFSDFAALCQTGESGGEILATDQVFLPQLFNVYDESRTAFLATILKNSAA